MRGVSRVLVILGLIISVFAGVQMVSLESQAGNTVAESFYNNMGWLGVGLALLLLAIFISLDLARRPSQPFLGTAGQCPSCRQIISGQAETCPYCHVRLTHIAAPSAPQGG